MSTERNIPSSDIPLDAIHIKDIRVPVCINPGPAYAPLQSAPGEETILITITLFHDVSIAAATDNLSYSINYAEIYDRIRGNCSGKQYANLGKLVEQAHAQVTDFLVQSLQVKVRATQTNVSEASSFAFELEKDSSVRTVVKHTFRIEGLACSTIIGVNESERHTKQPVSFDLTVRRSLAESPVDFVDMSTLARIVKEHVHGTSFLTLEALASSVASRALQILHADDKITVKASKPQALSEAEAPQVELSRRRQDFPDMFPRGPGSTPVFTRISALLASVFPTISGTQGKLATAGIALGSNLGDRFANIETALRLLERPTSLLDDLKVEGEGKPEVAVVNTSFMYETMPMYVTDQPRFANCACMVETNLPPTELLRLLKKIEVTVGRVPSIRNGPRAVDLDVLLYDSDVIDTRPSEARRDLNNLEGQLVVPHPRMAERGFVLQPLADMIPDFVHPVLRKPISTLLRTLASAHPEDVSAMAKVMPFPQYPFTGSGIPSKDLPAVPPTAKHWTFGHPPGKTYVMATLNATPDSFSDGSVNNTLEAAVKYATKAVASGADIIDIGGYSTRPGAAFVSDEEEISRVVPIIKAIRAQTDAPEVANAFISIDTFRHTVAEAAVLAGANCINDVYAFGGPEYPLNPNSARHFAQFRQTSRDLNVPVILMHSRGDAGSNKDYSAFSGGVLEGVRRELGDRVEAVVTGRGGIRRWLVMVDPGVGFSKTIEGNLALLRHASSLTSSAEGNALSGYPQLIGTSKKSFLGKILEREDNDGSYAGRATEAGERGWATAAAVTCAVQQGATVVRVHDVQEMKDVVVVASAIWS